MPNYTPQMKYYERNRELISQKRKELYTTAKRQEQHKNNYNSDRRRELYCLSQLETDTYRYFRHLLR
jgi:hypothetical protein